MPEQTFTRLSGYHPTGSEVNLGDRIFNGSPQINPLLRTAAGGLPYVGVPYTAGRGINALLHFLGRQGVFSPNSSSGPNSESGYGGPVYGGTAPVGPGTFANDPTDPNNPGAYSLGSPGTSAGDKPATAGYNLPGLLQMWNSGRIPGAPAFSPTLAQLQFPGSRIGPGGTSVSNPYNPAATHGTPNSVFTGLSGPAVDWAAELAKRNQL